MLASVVLGIFLPKVLSFLESYCENEELRTPNSRRLHFSVEIFFTYHIHQNYKLFVCSTQVRLVELAKGLKLV
jgi:hypothetical protein